MSISKKAIRSIIKSSILVGVIASSIAVGYYYRNKPIEETSSYSDSIPDMYREDAEQEIVLGGTVDEYITDSTQDNIYIDNILEYNNGTIDYDTLIDEITTIFKRHTILEIGAVKNMIRRPIISEYSKYRVYIQDNIDDTMSTLFIVGSELYMNDVKVFKQDSHIKQIILDNSLDYVTIQFNDDSTEIINIK